VPVAQAFGELRVLALQTREIALELLDERVREHGRE
jgi:hypothetical protein